MSSWSSSDIPDLHDRVALVTGSTGGVGFETAKALAAHGASVVMTARDAARGQAAARRVVGEVDGADVSVEALDLASMASVRDAAVRIGDRYPRLDVLINNAGVMYGPRARTVDGFELHLATNHLGHFALTGLLLPSLLRAPDARVVTVSSPAYRFASRRQMANLDGDRLVGRSSAYNRSKLANVLFALALDRRFAEVAGVNAISVLAFPGAADTGIMRSAPALMRPALALFRLKTHSAAQGALPALRAATDPPVRGGQGFEPADFFGATGSPVRTGLAAVARDVALQERLWSASEKMTGVSPQLFTAT
jgi:NAD(P)-dependent dehydrogenase (short-subunit alcohol dehydrogenase family)